MTTNVAPDPARELLEAVKGQSLIELFVRSTRPGWTVWGNEAVEGYEPTWDTHTHNSADVLVGSLFGE